MTRAARRKPVFHTSQMRVMDATLAGMANQKTSPSKKTNRAPKKKIIAADGTVNVRVDAKLERAWKALAKVIASAKKQGAKEFDLLWEAAGAVVSHNPPLYVVAGYANAKEFFQKELGENLRNASRNVRVARFATPTEEETYGVTKLDAALAFIEAKLGTDLEHPPLPIAFDRLRIPKASGGSLSLEKARVEDISAATRVLLKKPNEPTSSAERALMEACKKHPAFSDVRVRVRNGLANVTGVPIASMHVFGTMLTQTDWGEATSAKRKTSAKKRSNK